MAVGYGGSTQSTSTSFTGPTVSGSDTLGLVSIHMGQSGTVSSVTWGGSSMTRLTPSASRRLHIFYIASPSSAATVAVTDSPGNTQNMYAATYLTGVDSIVQNADGTSADATECTATLGSNTTSGRALVYIAHLYGGDVETATLGSWEVNGSTTGVTEAWTATDSGSGYDVHGGMAYDMDGATGSTDSMSVTPSGATSGDDMLCVVMEISAAATATTVTPATIATTTAFGTPTPQGKATASPATIATTTAVAQSTPQGKALTQPASIATVSTVDQPAIAIGKTVTPATIATVTGMSAPTPLGAASVSVSVIATTSTVGQPGIAVAKTVTPTVIVTTMQIPLATPTASKTVTPGSIATVVAMSAPTPLGAALVTPDVIRTLVEIATPTLGGVTIEIIAQAFYRFLRINGQLILSPIGRSTQRGFRTSEGFEVVSSIVKMDQLEDSAGSPTRAMEAVASAWAANSGAAAATLKTAIDTALQSAGWRGPGNTDLV